ncbi:MAG: hypothetical protein KTR32_20545 [Granulosicoccus sp.]|nr:hypothetical protein [Granulosicoccus sp.]
MTIRDIVRVFSVFMLILLVFPSVGHTRTLSAFAGAEGAGALSSGGRGGRIIEVTNLNDSGPGSLRAAIDAEGPRIVIFRVGGIINLESRLTIRNPYITLAGHTAPGGGILINGKEAEGASLVINSHDVIVRYLRIRNGAGGGTEEDDAIGITAGYNIIVDHCSVSWSTDENFSTWAWKHEKWGEPKDITWSYNLVAEGILDHSKAMLTGASTGPEADEMTNIDIHHNLFVHHYDRNPFMKHKSGRIVNNIAYNWAGYGLTTNGGVHFDIIGNLFKAGPDYDAGNSVLVVALLEARDASTFDPDNCPENCPHLYVKGNVTPAHSDTTLDHWGVLSASWNSQTEVTLDYKRDEPLSGQIFPISASEVSELEEKLLPVVGASHRLNEKGELVENRDAVDLRVIDDYINETGSVIRNENEVGGLPEIAAGTPYPDADHDGMSDTWERMVGLDPTNSNDGNLDRNLDGISNIEEFLDGNIPRSIVRGTGSVSYFTLMIGFLISIVCRFTRCRSAYPAHRSMTF